MYLPAHAHVDLLLNGHRVVGWAEDDPPYDWDYEESSQRKRGQDGTLYGLSLPAFGGTFRGMLQPGSPSTRWCIQQEQLRKNAIKDRMRPRVFGGSFSDPAFGLSYTLSGGIIVIFPATMVANRSYEFSIEFEEITSSVDGAVFQPPLASDIPFT